MKLFKKLEFPLKIITFITLGILFYISLKNENEISITIILFAMTPFFMDFLSQLKRKINK